MPPRMARADGSGRHRFLRRPACELPALPDTARTAGERGSTSADDVAQDNAKNRNTFNAGAPGFGCYARERECSVGRIRGAGRSILGFPKLFRLCDRCQRPDVLPLDWRLRVGVFMVIREREWITPDAINHDFALLQCAAVRPCVPCNVARLMKSRVI